MPSRRCHHVSPGACAGPLPGALAVPGRHRKPRRAAIPAFGQVRQAQGTGAARGLRRCRPRCGRPRRRRPAEPAGPSPASGSRGPGPRGRLLRRPVRRRWPWSTPAGSAGSPGSRRPSHRTRGRSDLNREAEPPCHLAACGAVTDLMFTAAIYSLLLTIGIPRVVIGVPGWGFPPRFVILPHRRNGRSGWFSRRGSLPSRPSYTGHSVQGHARIRVAAVASWDNSSAVTVWEP